MKTAPGESLTEGTGCTCGCGGQGKKRIIFPCAGASNVGQLTNIAALELEDEGYGTFACTVRLAAGAAEMREQCREADEIVVLDGCGNRCAATVAAAEGIEPDQALVVSELGIEASHDFEISDEEIEVVLGAVWEGHGRGEKRPPHGHAGDCTCGCGRR